MCGIAGFVGPGDEDDLSAMMQALVHRGPDGAGRHSDPARSLYLGHRRLAVIDVAAGAQPMWNRQGTVAVVFNGEIYNHRELRATLEALGHVFTTDHCDTEVLVHGYSQWGEALPLHLNGMFAFCIYDAIRQRLFLSRDRFGEKPLYLARQGPLFAFASELSAITRHSVFTTRLDARSVQKFFAYGFVPAPRALYENCEKLPGGCSAIFDLRTRELTIKRYWRFLIEADRTAAKSENELAEELRALVIQAVERRLMADVPVGFFLSGGVDSSAIAAAAARLIPADRVEAFTLGVLEPSFDETAAAAAAASALGVSHFIEQLDLDAARLRLPDVLGRLDEPSGDPSILPTALLAAFARTRVTVALSGDGADELFAGYDPFKALAPARLYKAFVPRPLHSLLREAAHRLPISDRNMSLDFKLRRTLGGLGYGAPYWNPIWLGPLDPEAQADIFNRPLTPEDLYSEALELWSAGSSPSLVDKTLEFYSNFYLQDGILQKVDRATMMSSLEARSPFLDNDLVEFCRHLPHHYKFKRGARKYLLKKALRGLVPDDVLKRPKKGFGMPVSKWLRALPEPPVVRTTPEVKPDGVQGAWAEHKAQRADHRLFLWSWLSLQSLDGAEPTKPVSPAATEVAAGSTSPATALAAPL